MASLGICVRSKYWTFLFKIDKNVSILHIQRSWYFLLNYNLWQKSFTKVGLSDISGLFTLKYYHRLPRYCNVDWAGENQKKTFSKYFCQTLHDFFVSNCIFLMEKKSGFDCHVLSSFFIFLQMKFAFVVICFCFFCRVILFLFYFIYFLMSSVKW